MSIYTVILSNAGGTRDEDYGRYDSVKSAIQHAARVGRTTMTSVFGPDDYKHGEVWNVLVIVEKDEFEETFEPKPCVYIKTIATIRRR